MGWGVGSCEAGKFFESGGSNGKVVEAQKGSEGERFGGRRRRTGQVERGCGVSEREHCVGGGYYCERERVILRRRDYYWEKVGTDKREWEEGTLEKEDHEKGGTHSKGMMICEGKNQTLVH